MYDLVGLLLLLTVLFCQFSFENLGLTLKKDGRSVLNGVTGTIYHGRVTAVMGPSGAGNLLVS